MEDQGEEVSWYSFIGNLKLGRHDVYEAHTISKINEDAATAPTQLVAELKNMNYDLFTGGVLRISCCASELETTEEKFEDDDAHGPDIEALWYMSLKVKIKANESQEIKKMEEK